jgi:hypothetical protein
VITKDSKLNKNMAGKIIFVSLFMKNMINSRNVKDFNNDLATKVTFRDR